MKKGNKPHTKGSSGEEFVERKQPKLESNWSRYDEFVEGEVTNSTADNRVNVALDSLGLDFAKLLTESRDLSKIVLRSSEVSNQSVGGLNNLFKIDVNKLSDALNCQPFYLNFGDCERGDYFDNEVLTGFEASAKENGENFRLKWQKKSPEEKKEEREKKPDVEAASKQTNLELTSPKEQNIDDWLDDLIN